MRPYNRANRNSTRNLSRLGGIKASSLYFLNDISNVEGVGGQQSTNQDQREPQKSWKELYSVNTELLGRGHFSKVYKARSTSESGASVAVKVIRRRRRGIDMYDQIMLEVELMKMCRKMCAGFLQLIDYHVTNIDIALVMELASGGSIYDVVYSSRSGVPEAYCKIVMAKVMSALQFVHSHQIVHLDIKADNILLRHPYPSTDAVICDFGVAKKLTNGKVHREFVGTPDYIAPEIANYEEITCKTDIWSMGVLCYFLLTNISPFLSLSKDETMKNISGVSYEFLGSLKSESLSQSRHFISSLLKKNSRERPSAAECLQFDYLSSVSILQSDLPAPSNGENEFLAEKAQVRTRQDVTPQSLSYRHCMAISQYEINSFHHKHTLGTGSNESPLQSPLETMQPIPINLKPYEKPCSLMNLASIGITESSSVSHRRLPNPPRDNLPTEDEVSVPAEFGHDDPDKDFVTEDLPEDDSPPRIELENGIAEPCADQESQQSQDKVDGESSSLSLPQNNEQIETNEDEHSLSQKLPDPDKSQCSSIVISSLTPEEDRSDTTAPTTTTTTTTTNSDSSHHISDEITKSTSSSSSSNSSSHTSTQQDDNSKENQAPTTASSNNFYEPKIRESRRRLSFKSNEHRNISLQKYYSQSSMNTDSIQPLSSHCQAPSTMCSFSLQHPPIADHDNTSVSTSSTLQPHKQRHPHPPPPQRRPSHLKPQKLRKNSDLPIKHKTHNYRFSQLFDDLVKAAPDPEPITQPILDNHPTVVKHKSPWKSQPALYQKDLENSFNDSSFFDNDDFKEDFSAVSQTEPRTERKREHSDSTHNKSISNVTSNGSSSNLRSRIRRSMQSFRLHSNRIVSSNYEISDTMNGSSGRGRHNPHSSANNKCIIS